MGTCASLQMPRRADTRSRNARCWEGYQSDNLGKSRSHLFSAKWAYNPTAPNNARRAPRHTMTRAITKAMLTAEDGGHHDLDNRHGTRCALGRRFRHLDRLNWARQPSTQIAPWTHTTRALPTIDAAFEATSSQSTFFGVTLTLFWIGLLMSKL